MYLPKRAAPRRLRQTYEKDNPLRLVNIAGGQPNIDFYWKEVAGKRRLIGNPNEPMRRLHKLFAGYLIMGIAAMGDKDNYPLRRLPSSSAFVRESNPLKNAHRHRGGKFFYIADIWNAYPSVDLEKLASLIVYIRRYAEYQTEFSLLMFGQNYLFQYEMRSDPLFEHVLFFLKMFCSGIQGHGLAVGGPISPYLFNLYCEAYSDGILRRLCARHEIVFTRYADDYVFSREKPIISDIRREIRRVIEQAGFSVNHRKSKVLSREMGTVFVTKVGLGDDPAQKGGSQKAILVFPQKKRRRLHGMIGSYLAEQMDWPEKVGGLISEFLYYFKNVENKTRTDLKTFALCKEFEAEWAKYKKPAKLVA